MGFFGFWNLWLIGEFSHSSILWSSALCHFILLFAFHHATIKWRNSKLFKLWKVYHWFPHSTPAKSRGNQCVHRISFHLCQLNLHQILSVQAQNIDQLDQNRIDQNRTNVTRLCIDYFDFISNGSIQCE